MLWTATFFPSFKKEVLFLLLGGFLGKMRASRGVREAIFTPLKARKGVARCGRGVQARANGWRGNNG